jgi:hypothetical protein
MQVNTASPTKPWIPSAFPFRSSSSKKYLATANDKRRRRRVLTSPTVVERISILR